MAQTLRDTCIEAILQHDFWRVQMRYFQFLDPETCNRIVQTLVNQGRLRPHQLHIFSQCTTQLKLMALGLKVQQWLAPITALHNSLRELDLGWNGQLNDDVGPIIAKLTRLEVLKMDGIDDEGVQDILQALRHCLRVFNASRCEGLNHFAFRYIHASARLEELYLTGCKSMDYRLLEHISHLSNLRVLSIGHTSIESVPMQPPSLGVLHLQSTTLNDVGPHEPPVELPHLQEVYASDLCLNTTEAWSAFFLLLRHTTRLERLAIDLMMPPKPNSDDEDVRVPSDVTNALTFHGILDEHVDVSRLTTLHLAVFNCSRQELIDIITKRCPLLHEVAFDFFDILHEPCLLGHAVALASRLPHLAWLQLRDQYHSIAREQPMQALYNTLRRLWGEHGFVEATQFDWTDKRYMLGLHAPGRKRDGVELWDLPEDDSTHRVLVMPNAGLGNVVEHMLSIHSSVIWVELDCVHNVPTLQRLRSLPNLKLVTLYGFASGLDIKPVLQLRHLHTIFLDFSSEDWAVYQQEGWLARESAMGWKEQFRDPRRKPGRTFRKLVPHVWQPDNMPDLALGRLTTEQRAMYDQRYRYSREKLLMIGAAQAGAGALLPIPAALKKKS